MYIYTYIYKGIPFFNFLIFFPILSLYQYLILFLYYGHLLHFLFFQNFKVSNLKNLKFSNFKP